MDIKTFRRKTPSSVGRSGKIFPDLPTDDGVVRLFPDLPTDDGMVRRNVCMSIPTIPPSKSASSDFPFTLHVLARHYTTGGTWPPFSTHLSVAHVCSCYAPI